MSELAALDELAALYRELDARFAGARCANSSECCRFGITGREPQVTSVEVALLERAIARRGGTLSKARRALPIRAGDERTCPLLERPGRCSVYDARPLGCRTYFCGRAEHDDPPSRDELRDFVRQLQDIALRHRRGGDRPEGLTAALTMAARRR